MKSYDKYIIVAVVGGGVVVISIFPCHCFFLARIRLVS